MSRLSNAFERLIATHPTGDPDDILARARRRADTVRRHRALTFVVGAAAAVVVMVAAVAMMAVDPVSTVHTGPAANGTGPSGPGTTTVDVFFSPRDNPRCKTTNGFARQVAPDDPPTGAVKALLAGPTPGEVDQGLTSYFSADTEGMLRSVDVVDGTAFVDFKNFASIIPNASTSCGSRMLLGQLDATVTQFPGVNKAIYSFDGDATAFYGWLQRVTPDGARPTPPDIPGTTTSTTVPGPTTVDVFFSPRDNPRCKTTNGFARQVAPDDPPTGAVKALLAGPTPGEVDQGLTSYFSADTEGMLRSVDVVDGTAFVDFKNFASIIPNASTSCGSRMLLGQLDATVTQFPGVNKAIYSFDGDATAFYGWLQMSPPDGARPTPPNKPGD